MPSQSEQEVQYQEVIGYRPGARFDKMDLHTHTPASECSSFSPPDALDAVLKAHKPSSGKKKACRNCVSFLLDLEAGKDPFTPVIKANVDGFSRVVSGPVDIDARILQRIANSWLDDIRTHRNGELTVADVSTRGPEYDMLVLAMRDLRNYISSLFFPDEFVIRCYIEELSVVALTDHNHPGYIVPRLPELGTWYEALEQVNAVCMESIQKNAGATLLGAIRNRLATAASALSLSTTTTHLSPTLRKQHREAVRKTMKTKADRKKHIIEREKYWTSGDAAPRPLILFPGVEITVSAVHMLAVFPPTWYAPVRIAAILRTIGIPEEQWGRGFMAAASSSVQDTLSLVDENGGIAIPAHSNSDFKGILRLFRKGLELKKVLEHPALLAMESVGGSVIAGEGKKKGKDACETLRWLNEDRGRPDRVRPLSFTKGSDAHECRIELDGTGEDLGIRYTNVKIDLRPLDTPAEVFAALRMALISAQSRIIEFPIEDGYNYHATGKKYRIKKEYRADLLNAVSTRFTILGLMVEGDSKSYARDLRIRFNPYLNCVVGGGGKSTLVRLTGYAFGVMGFMPWTPPNWLPTRVTAFWTHGGNTYCVVRDGRGVEPTDSSVVTTWYQRNADGTWNALSGQRANTVSSVCSKIQVWPPADVQNASKRLDKLQGSVVEQLAAQLQVSSLEDALPLLVNQPGDIFDARPLFEAVLSKPYLKARQIIWSTGSANVPVAMDAEKIIVTGEVDKGKHMTFVCAGDFSEDNVREQFLDYLEGGYQAFARRRALYGLDREV